MNHSLSLKIFPSLITLLIIGFLPMTNIQAKRSAPAPVEPVSFEGIRYEVSGMGVVLAWDEKNNQELWKKKIYEVSHKSNLETDVQDIWITKLEVAKGVLLVTNEKKNVYEVDLTTGEVIHRSLESGKTYGMYVIGGLVVLILAGIVIAVFLLRR